MSVFSRWRTWAAPGQRLGSTCLLSSYTSLLLSSADVCFIVCFSFPEAFESFAGFRKLFPAVSSYCFCSDSRGREMHHTGTLTSAKMAALSPSPSKARTEL